MSEPETVKVELEIPVNVYKAIEYICNLEPVKDIKKYMVWCLEADAEGMTMGDWAEHNNFINQRIKALLKGDEGCDSPRREIRLEEEAYKVLEDLAEVEGVSVEAMAVRVIKENLERLQQ